MLPDIAIAEHLAERILAVEAGELPAAAREKCEETTVDVVGLQEKQMVARVQVSRGAPLRGACGGSRLGVEPIAGMRDSWTRLF